MTPPLPRLVIYNQSPLLMQDFIPRSSICTAPGQMLALGSTLFISVAGAQQSAPHQHLPLMNEHIQKSGGSGRRLHGQFCWGFSVPDCIVLG